MESKYKKKALNYRSPDIYRSISRVGNVSKRNVVRGYAVKTNLTTRNIDNIRSRNSLKDITIIGGILKGPNGLADGDQNKIKKTSDNLFTLVDVKPLDWKHEVCYTAGCINAHGDTAIDMLEIIKSFAFFEEMDVNTALKLILDISKKHGASNFLSYKLAYLKVFKEISAESLSLVSEIESEFHHRENAGLHFSALENLSSKISLFEAAQRRVGGLVGRVNGDFRKALSLSNFIPTPIRYEDVSGFLLRSTESCLLDTVHSVLIIFNLKSQFSGACQEFRLRLKPEFLEQIEYLSQLFSKESYKSTFSYIWKSEVKNRNASLDLYRISSAFLERSEFAVYRNKLDKVIGLRLLSEVIGPELGQDTELEGNKHLILMPNGAALSENFPIVLDEFYRTYLFLKMIRNRSNLLGISSTEIKYIFENTFGLQSLLSEVEMETIHITAPPEAKRLVTVLSLALHRQKSIDPDIDFNFRNSFIAIINESYGGSIVEFIEDILVDSPEIANYLVDVLDESTLEKMYSLVKSASDASKVRCDILRAIGQRLNRIEYFIEADAITTRLKVSELQQYFDSSRIYVDSITMKKWLDSNPTVSTEQYRTLFPRVEARISSMNSDDTRVGNLYFLQLIDQSEYLILQIVKDAFEQFCLNTEFGIESYLGRRIRHNTIDGVTSDPIDAVLAKQEYRALLTNRQISQHVESWMNTYKSIIDKLKRDYLQFKTSQSLFNATIDVNESYTKENIRILVASLRATGGNELLNDLVISFCWRQISPQLENAARYIKTEPLKEANSSIDKHFSNNSSPLEGQLKTDLLQAVNEVFKKISDWFQVPQTGFISASIRDLCQIISIDFNRSNAFEFSGDDLDIKFTGISVHRLYDCLAVLLQNACIHGEDGTSICVNVFTKKKSVESVLDIISVRITSVVSEDKYQYSKQRISDAIEAPEAGIDMVTEGYSGIKKIKFITRLSEGFSTVQCLSDEDHRKLTLCFSMHAEKATEESASGGAL